MGVLISPLGDFVVAVGEEAESKTASGLYLPGNAQEKPKVAKVLAVGKDAKQVKVGDRIIYKNFSNTNVPLGKEEYILVKEEDVLATVKAEGAK